MKHHTSLILVAAVAVSGCVNYKSFNAGETPQPAPSSTATPAKPSPTPAKKAQPARAQSAQSQPSASPAPASVPKPTPSSSVIKEETTSEVKVISSRPVVGSDAEMGN